MHHAERLLHGAVDGNLAPHQPELDLEQLEPVKRVECAIGDAVMFVTVFHQRPRYLRSDG